MSCPACNKVNTPETGVPFPTDISRFVRYCLLLNIDTKSGTLNKQKALICFDHFDPKDHVKTNGKVTGVKRFAFPLKAKKKQENNDMGKIQTLDQLLAQNVGIATTSSCSTSTAKNNQPTTGIALPLPSQTNSTRTTAPSPAALSKLANRTIVIYRQKKPGTSPAGWSLLYFREWLLNSFNLPTSAIHEQSQIVNVADFCINFVLLDEEQTIETILTMFRSTSPNKYQCMLDSAANILKEGSQILKKQKGGGESSNEMNLPECFALLIPSLENNPTIDQMDMRMEVDDDQNAWNNIAAAGREVHFLNSPAVKFYDVNQRRHYFRTEFLQRLKQIFERDDHDEHNNFQIMPVYRNILMATNSPQSQQNNNIANNISSASKVYRDILMAASSAQQNNDNNASTSNLPIPSFATSMINPTSIQSNASMQQNDKTNHQPQSSRIPRPR